MNTTEQALLILLAITDIAFLIVSIIFGILLIKTTKKVKHVAEKAGETAENLAGATKAVKQTLMRPSVITSAVANIVNNIVKRRKR